MNAFQSVSINQLSTHLMPTSKYKTNYISLYIRQPLEEEHHTKVALIPAILKRGTEQHPTARSIRQELDQLYGASLDADVVKRGEEQVIIFRMQLANEKFLKDQTPLFDKGLQLLSEVLSSPILENGHFLEKYVQLEKDLLHRRLSQIKDDKVRYANMRCTEEMYKGERFSLFANGSIKQLEQITAKDLYAYYQKMISSHPMELFIAGDIDSEQVKELVSKHFQFNRDKLITFPSSSKEKQVERENIVTEKTKIAQGKLHIGCRTHTSYQDDDYIPLVVCNGVFGGFSHSKLFRNVREKESLAYYVSSSMESHKGLMMIISGIDFPQYDKTVQIIKEQLDQVKNGVISDEEMSQTKAVIINQIKEANDQPFMLMERHFHGIVGNISILR